MSREIQALMESLDRKIDRFRSARSRAMCLEVDVSGTRESTRPKPVVCELFTVYAVSRDEIFTNFVNRMAFVIIYNRENL